MLGKSDVVIAAALCVLSPYTAHGAESWLARPVRLVVASVPGGAVDTVARVVGERLTATLGRPVIVDNRPGAAGTIALDSVAKANADGHTLIAVTDSIAVMPFLNRKLSFDPQTSFTPVVLTATQPRVLAVHSSLPAASFKDFAALAKAKPGALSYAAGSTAHRLTAELIKKLAGIDMVHVPYKGGAQAVADLAGGQVPAAVVGLSPVLPQSRAGKVRMLAVTSSARSALVPSVPTLAESGLSGFDVYEWIIFLAPAKTPRETVNRLNDEITKIVTQPAVRERLEAASLEAKTASPREVTALIRETQARWSRLISDLGLRLEQ